MSRSEILGWGGGREGIVIIYRYWEVDHSQVAMYVC